MMSEATLVRWLDQDRDHLVCFLQDLVRAKSPNPPGDTREAARVVVGYLNSHGLECESIEPLEKAPSLVSSFRTQRDGPHLVLNGHLDTYPCDDAERWNQQPYGGTLVDGAIYGRGASDMKAGTAAIAIAFAYLHRLRESLRGRVTFTAVSDEETGGEWGARYLLQHSEVRGDCLLNAEPGAPTTVRYGEKGSLKLRFKMRTLGCHGAYTHKSKSANKVAAALVRDLREIANLPVTVSDNVGQLLDDVAPEFDRVHGTGAAQVLREYTVNVGTVRGGVKMNMLPANCDCEVDIRIPIGGTADEARAKADEIAARHPEVSVETMSLDEPNWSDPDHPLLDAIRTSGADVFGSRVSAATSLGATDARHWRAAGVPAFTYGTTATNVAMADEHTQVDEYLGVIKVHALAAYRYLRKE